jgi:hypothetical protein
MRKKERLKKRLFAILIKYSRVRGGLCPWWSVDFVCKIWLVAIKCNGFPVFWEYRYNIRENQEFL